MHPFHHIPLIDIVGVQQASIARNCDEVLRSEMHYFELNAIPGIVTQFKSEFSALVQTNQSPFAFPFRKNSSAAFDFSQRP